MPTVLCSCGAEVLYDAGQDHCPGCNANLRELSKEALSRAPSSGFRRARVTGEVLVYERQDTTSTVVGQLQKGDQVAVGPDRDNGQGQKWFEVQMRSGQGWRTRAEQGFVLKSGALSLPSPALGFGILGLGLVLVATIVYLLIVGKGVSIGALAMIALGIYGACIGFSKKR